MVNVILDMRYVMRGGEKILQKLILVEYMEQDFTGIRTKYMWVDVPIRVEDVYENK